MQFTDYEDNWEGEAEHLIKVPEEASDKRVDVFVAQNLDHCTRSFVQKLIDDGRVQVNSHKVKANFRLTPGQEVAVFVPPPEQLAVEPEDIPIDIVYEDEDLLVVNKPQGMVVHPAAGNYTGTLVNALLYHCRDLSGINGVLRPGIVHRIDKDTSGLLAVAKSETAHLGLAEQIKVHSMTRRYKAIVYGMMPEPGGTIDAPIGRDPKDRKKMAVVYTNSRPAVTHYKVLERFRQFSYIEARLETGRTHQIRVHMAYIDHPVVGDPVYGPRKNKFDLAGQVLHAAALGFVHPISKDHLEFSCPLPRYFKNLLNFMRETNC